MKKLVLKYSVVRVPKTSILGIFGHNYPELKFHNFIKR